MSSIRRSLLHRCVVALVLVATGLIAFVAVPSSRAATTTVNISNFEFDAPTVNIAVGDTVTWTNLDNAPHNAVDVDNQPPTFSTMVLSKNESDSVTFNTAGTFNYYCSIHTFMRGVVVVGGTPFSEAVYLPSVTR